MPFNDLVEFVIYVIPGFLVVEIYRASYPAKQKSEFQQIGWSILYGLFIVSVVKWVDKLALQNTLYSNYNGIPGLRFTFTLLLMGIICGLLLILLHKLRYYLSKKQVIKFLAPDPQSIWAKINQIENKDWCAVYLDDGAVYLGYISEFTFDPDKEYQDFLLSCAKRVDDQLEIKYEISGIGVYLNTKDIKRIEFIKGEQSGK